MMKHWLMIIALCFALTTFGVACDEDEVKTTPDKEDPIKPDLGGDDDEDEGKEDDDQVEDAPDQNEEFSIEIANWDFEEEVDFTGQQGAWIKQEGWKGYNANVTYEPNGGYRSSGGLKIECTAETTDMPVSQTVTGLIPDKLYELSAMIKVKGITPNKGRGGTIGLYGQQVWTSTEPYTGSHDWEKRSVKFIADKETIDIACRLGFTAGDSDGTAWFDDVKLGSPLDIYHRESDHVVIYVEKDLVKISNNKIDAWLDKLDDIYDAYTELFDFFLPFEGKKMIILSKIIDAWAYAGYPIEWNTNYIESTFDEIQRYDNTVFGLMHEMGHNFAPGNYRSGKYEMGNYDAWNWNEELFANFRMYYALDKTNHPTFINNQLYHGAEIIHMYKEQYEKSLAAGKADGGDGLMYIMCEMVNDHGWEPFKKTFRELYDLDPAICKGEKEQRWPKIENFFIVLSKHAGRSNILAEYLTTEQINLLKTL